MKVDTLLKGQEIGQYITEELSELLKKHSGSKERAEASIKSDVGIYTIQSLIVRRNPLTESNYAGLVAVVETTINKCKGTEADVEYLQSLLS